MSSSANRVLIYSHDTFGIGNMRRTLEVCHALSAETPDLSILVLTGSPYFDGFRKPDNVELIKLPELRRRDRGSYEARARGFGSDDVWRMREEICMTAASHFAPDLMFVDKGPFGVADELRQAIEAVSHEVPRCVKVLALRDILDDPDSTREEFRRTNRVQDIVDHYDHVWVFGHQDLFDLALLYELPPALAERLTYLGFIGRTESVSAPEDIRARVQAADGPMLLVTAGGGDDGEHLLTTFASAMPELRRRHPQLTNVVVSGPQSSRTTRESVANGCAADPKSVHVEFAPDLVSYMRAADAVMCMGGYNTVCEVLMLGAKATIVPRSEPVREQLVRAQIFADLGAVRLCTPQSLTPGRVIDEVGALLNGWSPTPLDTRLTRFDAHVEAARAIAALLQDPRATIPVPVESATQSAVRTA